MTNADRVFARTLLFCALSCAVADAGTLPLTLKLWTIRGAPTVTCTGKSWVDLGPGILNRDAVIVLLSTPSQEAHNQRLLACDDGSGHDAPVKGAMSQVQVVHAGQNVLQGPMRVIILKPHAKPGRTSAVVLAVSKLAGDVALEAKNGGGTLRLDHTRGISIYPASYKVVKVTEISVFEVDTGPPPVLQPCTLFYFQNDPTARVKVVKSRMDCVSLIESADAGALFAGKVPEKI